MAPKDELTTWCDAATGKKFVQIHGQIYEQLAPVRPGRRTAEAGGFGWGDVPDGEDAGDGWKEKRRKRWQRAHKLQQHQLSFNKGVGKGGGKTSGQKQPPVATEACKKNAGKGTCKGSSRPKGGAYYPSARPWVPCCYPLCPGHNGRNSFKFLDAIGQGEHGLCCMGCNTPWAQSLEEAGFGEHKLAGGAGGGLEPASENPSLASSAGGSPFNDEIDITYLVESKAAPFVKLGSEGSRFRQLPQQALDACPEQLRATLSMHLLRKAVPAEQIAKLEQMAAEGQEVAKAFMAAVAIALPFLEAKPMPRTSAPKMAAKDNRSAKQETSASYTALQSALSESQRSEAGKHKIQNALTIAKEAKRKLAEDFATRDQKLTEDIQRYEEELTKADAE